MTKPPIPARMFDDWPRIPVDTSRDSVFTRVERIAQGAAAGRVLGPEGPYKRPDQSLAEIVHGAVREGPPSARPTAPRSTSAPAGTPRTARPATP